MTSQWTRARVMGIRAAWLALLLPMAATSNEVTTPAKPATTSATHHVVIGLGCEGSPTLVREPHHWDPRIPNGGAPEECLDGTAKVRISPSKVDLRYNRATEHLEVVLTISEVEGHAIGELFSEALKSGVTRRDLILIDGKVIVKAFVFGKFSGTTLEIDVGSDEGAKAVAALLNGESQDNWKAG